MTDSGISPVCLTEGDLFDAVDVLCERDPDLAQIVDRWGLPPMWAREPGFPTLVHIILEQQVSRASARAAFERLCDVVSPLTPEGFLVLDDTTLRAVGFSRQKAGYGRSLAQAIVSGQLDLVALETRADQAVRAELCALKGIGPWSADIYLLMALRRPDVWPAGDIALASAAQDVKQLAARPTPGEMEEIGTAWRPWRAAAARLLWHHYLSCRRLQQRSRKR
ncbi:MAG: DNA-3-methyladenine glycosylase 2 family protein [Anaerolineae bacterium]|nr:DNA-3-methyladenine glycosylase 2 family protein [Anaerolineae bacterium]